jgi:hypothetical protein
MPEPPVSKPVIEKPEDVPAPRPGPAAPEKQKNRKDIPRRSIRRRPRPGQDQGDIERGGPSAAGQRRGLPTGVAG